jgi:hypothetical protein
MAEALSLRSVGNIGQSHRWARLPRNVMAVDDIEQLWLGGSLRPPTDKPVNDSPPDLGYLSRVDCYSKILEKHGQFSKK